MNRPPFDAAAGPGRTPLNFAADCFWVYVLILVLLVLSQPLQAAGVCAVGIPQYSCATVAVAGAGSTVVSGVNASGQMAGYYQLGNGSRHAFIQSAGGAPTATARKTSAAAASRPKPKGAMRTSKKQ